MPATSAHIAPPTPLHEGDQTDRTTANHITDHTHGADHAPASDSGDTGMCPPDQTSLQSDDAMAGIVIGGILTLAFSVLVVVMVIVNLWTFSSAG